MSEETLDTEDWKAFKRQRQEKRLGNQIGSTEILRSRDERFEVKNGGAHLIVKQYGGELIDYWPSTGKWIRRHDQRAGRGVSRLLLLLDEAASDGRKASREVST